MQKSRNKTLATIIALVLSLTIAIPLSVLPTVNAVYDNPTATAIAQGMFWDQNYNASATRILLWNRFADKIPTYVYMMAAPNPVGQGEAFNLIFFNPQVPQNSLLTNDIRYTYTIDVVAPDGSTETLPKAGATGGNIYIGGVVNGVFVSDSTGAGYTTYVPTQLGNYSFKVNFQQLFYRWNDTSAMRDYYGTTFKASSFTLKVLVQAEQSQLIGLPNIQAEPTEFWMRPIEGQNTNWYTVSSNWLSGPNDRDNYAGNENRFQQDGVAPNSPHILWTRPTEDNGVVGGSDLSRAGNVFNAGSQYQPRFTNQIIMYGRLYYSPNVYTSGSSSLMDCVDLKTGELLYEVDTKGENVPGLLGVSTTANMPQFGYYYSQDDPNEHGIQNPGWLFTSNYVVGYQPERGIPYLNILNVPSGFEIKGSAGENLRYVLTNLGTPSRPNYYLAQWNSSKVVPMIGAGSNPTNLPIPGNVPITPAAPATVPFPYSTFVTFSIFGATPQCSWAWNGTGWAIFDTATNKFVNTTATTVGNLVDTATTGYSTQNPGYDWNVTSPIQFTTAPTVRAAKLGDIMWGTNGSWPTMTSGPSYAYPDEVTIWAVSLNPSSLGQLIYMKNLKIDDATLNTNNMIERASGPAGVFVTLEVPVCKFHVYDMRTGTERFATDSQADINPYGYFTWPSLISATQTKIAYGILYTAGYTGFVSAYNLTDGRLVWRYEAPSGGAKIQNYVLMEGVIADGKIYVGTHEHSADTPLYKGERVRCLDALTGDVIWTMSGWAYPMTMAIADGVLIYWNNYDAQVYAVGKGPTSTTVEAPMSGVKLGDSLVIRGTVMDVSAGTKQKEQSYRFPKGVAAVSEASMSEWMEYVYMQKGFPSNCTGVEVTLSVLDSNNNFRDIGTATSDASGAYNFVWKPDIEGKYTVVARFAGSEGYYGSYAESAFNVDPAPPAAPEQPQPAPSNTDTYLAYATIAIIVAIAIVGVVLALVLRKRP